MTVSIRDLLFEWVNCVNSDQLFFPFGGREGTDDAHQRWSGNPERPLHMYFHAAKTACPHYVCLLASQSGVMPPLASYRHPAACSRRAYATTAPG